MKKIVLLNTLLLLTLFPFTTVNAESAYSGHCGSRVTWSYDAASGQLTISGDGAMYDYGTYGDADLPPWDTFKEKIQSVVVEEGVTEIGKRAFKGCTALEGFQLPTSVSKIGDYVFLECTALKKAEFGESVTSIGSQAFYGCSSLERVSIGNPNCEFAYGVLHNVFSFALIGYAGSTAEKYYEKELKNGRGASYISVDDISSIEGFYRDAASTATKVLLKWKVSRMDGYRLEKYDSVTKEWKQIGEVDGSVGEYSDSDIAAGNTYLYRICGVINFQGKTFTGAYKTAEVYVERLSDWDKLNQDVKSGKSAYVRSFPVTLKASAVTEKNPHYNFTKNSQYPQIFTQVLHPGNYVGVSELMHFIDNNGKYNICYSDSNYVYIERYNMNSMKFVSQLKLSKKYAELGDVVADENGNYYIVWGKSYNGADGASTLAVSKYTYSGVYVSTVEKKYSKSRNATKILFDAGTCVTEISDGLLLVHYARLMYNGHQSSGVFAVNTGDMSEASNMFTDIVYVSHSFDQRMIVDKDQHFLMADLGDAYPRGFRISDVSPNKMIRWNRSTISKELAFHFYGEQGANDTYSQLGNLIETQNGILLCGASGRQMDKQVEDSGRDFFVKLCGTYGNRLKNSTSRSGTSMGEAETDEGILWLTDYGKKYQVVNPQAVQIDDGRIVILWEKYGDDVEDYIDSYYLVLDANGTVLQNATSLNQLHLNACEQPVAYKNYVYWATAGRYVSGSIKTGPNSHYSGYKLKNGKKAQIYCLEIGKVVKVEKKVNVKKVKILSAKAKKKKIIIKWKKDSNVSGFQIQYARNKKFTKGKKTKTVGRKASQKTITGLKRRKTYYVRVRAYKKSSGKRVYGAWSKIKKVKIR